MFEEAGGGGFGASVVGAVLGDLADGSGVGGAGEVGSGMREPGSAWGWSEGLPG
jgi:hypothetical protein